jgi:hypothetical protein
VARKKLKKYIMRKSDGYIYPYNPIVLKLDLKGSLQEVLLTDEQFKAWQRGENPFEIVSAIKEKKGPIEEDTEMPRLDSPEYDGDTKDVEDREIGMEDNTRKGGNK